MADEESMTPREQALREDLRHEYYALVGAVAAVDTRLMVVKGWSVTLSLTALGLGFQQQHYALFALGAATAAAFWFLDGLMKGHQVRYYSRMRDLEVAAHELNRIDLGPLGSFSSPRMDSAWGFTGAGGRDWRCDPPVRRTAASVRRLLRLRFVLPNVMFPHVVAVVLGAALFALALLDVDGLADLRP